MQEVYPWRPGRRVARNLPGRGMQTLRRGALVQVDRTDVSWDGLQRVPREMEDG